MGKYKWKIRKKRGLKRLRKRDRKEGKEDREREN